MRFNVFFAGTLWYVDSILKRLPGMREILARVKNIFDSLQLFSDGTKGASDR